MAVNARKSRTGPPPGRTGPRPRILVYSPKR
jgi:hypothetical protein